jgi:hypothetical protein
MHQMLGVSVDGLLAREIISDEGVVKSYDDELWNMGEACFFFPRRSFKFCIAN